MYALLLKALEFPCVALHSILSQTERLAALAKFRAGRVRILVATDVASRFGFGGSMCVRVGVRVHVLCVCRAASQFLPLCSPRAYYCTIAENGSGSTCDCAIGA